MKSQWGKRNGCKFASDAVLKGDWKALTGLMIQGGLSADCPFPSNETHTIKLVTWAQRYNSTHSDPQLIPHNLEAKVSYGTPLLHQAIIAEGIDNKRSFKHGLQFLLDRGADIDLQDDSDGNTALHIASMLCRTQLIEFLISKKAKRDVENDDGLVAIETMPKWCKHIVRPNSYGQYVVEE
jgi:hypothetical protein